MNPEIFREYDIRGLADQELTNEVVYDLGRAFGTHMRRRELQELAVGRDVRLSSPRIRETLIEGLLSTGCNVTDLGVIPTPVFYFSIIHYGKDGGMMITGSHNPVEYNGFKVCRGPTTIYGEEIQELRRLVEAQDFISGSGRLDFRDPVEEYLRELEQRISVARPLKVVIDAGNGTAGPIATRLFQDLGCEVTPLYCEPDGRFPHHLPDPTIPECLQDLMYKVREEEADVGIGYDGDADRIGAVDDRGQIVWGDKLLALYAREVLEGTPGAKIIFDVKCSQGLVEDIEAHGGVPLMWKTGHSLIKARMREEGALLGGEMSGHMFFADNYYGYDDAIFASGRLVQLLSRTPKRFSELVAEAPAYYATPEIRVGCPDQEKFRIVEEVRDYFQSRYQTIDIDGVRVLFGDGWGLVRASNTQPILVLRFEARAEERLREIQETVLQRLREYPEVEL